MTLTTLKTGREGRKGRIKRTNNNYDENYQNDHELVMPSGATQETPVIVLRKDTHS